MPQPLLAADPGAVEITGTTLPAVQNPAKTQPGSISRVVQGSALPPAQTPRLVARAASPKAPRAGGDEPNSPTASRKSRGRARSSPGTARNSSEGRIFGLEEEPRDAHHAAPLPPCAGAPWVWSCQNNEGSNSREEGNSQLHGQSLKCSSGTQGRAAGAPWCEPTLPHVRAPGGEGVLAPKAAAPLEWASAERGRPKNHGVCAPGICRPGVEKRKLSVFKAPGAIIRLLWPAQRFAPRGACRDRLRRQRH